MRIIGIDPGSRLTGYGIIDVDGDRSAAVKDPCGNVWYLATHVEDVPPKEIERRAAALAAEGGGPA